MPAPLLPPNHWLSTISTLPTSLIAPWWWGISWIITTVRVMIAWELWSGYWKMFISGYFIEIWSGNSGYMWHSLYKMSRDFFVEKIFNSKSCVIALTLFFPPICYTTTWQQDHLSNTVQIVETVTQITNYIAKLLAQPSWTQNWAIYMFPSKCTDFMVGLDVTGFKGPLDNIVLKCSFALGSILQCITRLIFIYSNIYI